MQPQQCSRIDLGELKAHIVKKIGANRSKQYFYHLNRFLSQKLSKDEFDKFCIRVLGRENIQLHNQLLKSILKNVFQAKTPPPNHVSGHPKSVTSALNSSVREDVCDQRSTTLPNQNQNIPTWSNGVVPPSTRKGRSIIRKLRDRPSPLGPNGKVECLSHQSTGTEDSGCKVIMENGDASPCDYQRPVQHLQAVAQLPENKLEDVVQRPAEKPRIYSKIQAEAGTVEDGEEVEQSGQLCFSRRPLLAPLGIPFCSISVGGHQKNAHAVSSGDFVSYYDSGVLYDTEMLKKRMEQIASAQGLGDVSMESASTLNSMLDVYLKQLIRSCVELVGVRSINQHKRHPADKQQMQGKVINGMLSNNHLHVQNSTGVADAMQEQRSRYSISLQDFKLAMELNPKQLGEDWPLLLERISMHTFEE